MELAISIIMPVYNEATSIEESIRSCARQTIADKCELICVDDGSTDGSAEVIESLAEDLPLTVRVLRQQNQGSGKARNLGLASARGEYLAFLDGDDLYPSDDVLEVLYGKAKETGLPIVGGSIEILRAQGRTPFQPAGPFAKYYAGQVFDEDGPHTYEDYQFEFGFYRFIYSRKLIVDNGIEFPDFLRYQDPPFMAHAMAAGQEFYALAKTTYLYREDGSKQIKWTQRKICDALAGVLDVAGVATDHGYTQLYDNCIHRLCSDFAPRVAEYAIAEDDPSALEWLQQASDELVAMGKSLGLERDERLDRIPTPSNTAKLYEALKAADQTVAALRRDKDASDRRIQELEARVNDFETSNSWKIGRMVTWAPRATKGAIQRLLHP